MDRKEKLANLQNTLGYQFKDVSLLDCALIAPSYRGRNPDAVESDNQRLEFLGDAIYGLLAAEHVFVSCPELDEGELTLRVTHLANGRSLAGLARAINLQEFLLSASGGAVEDCCSDRELEDAFEALFGAVFCDGGFEAASALFHKLMHIMPDMPAERWHGNPKGALQELAQHHAWPDSPFYTLIDSTGPDHKPAYTMRVSVYGGFQAEFTAGTKRAAETGAAEALILLLKAEGFEV